MSHFGKYRGLVSDVKDPLKLGRIKARVPDVFGTQESGWALPCLPFAGQSMGFYALPKVGAGVWIEFEHGDLEYPIWSGCFYNAASEVPSNVLAPTTALLRSAAGNTVVLNDKPAGGGIVLKTQTGESLQISARGLELFDSSGQKIFSVGPEGLGFTGTAGQKLSVNPSDLQLTLPTGQTISLGVKGLSASSGQGATLEMVGPKVSINGTALEVL